MAQDTVSAEITACLVDVSRGDRPSDALLPLVYHELHGLAKAMLSRNVPGMTLQPTALVHEAYVKLVSPSVREWESRAHFFAVGARAMRQILINHVRDRNAKKRRASGQRVDLDTVALMDDRPTLDLLALDEALQDLTSRDERQAQVVELRFFGGLTIEESAAVMNVSIDTIKLEWRMAKAWLRLRLESVQ